MTADRGITQAERFSPALAPHSVVLDERSFAVLMAMAPQYAKLLNFYNADAELDGDWTPFFDNQLTFLLAMVCAWSPPQIDLPPPVDVMAKMGRAQWDLLQTIFHLAAGINQWFQHFQTKDSADLLRTEAPFFSSLKLAIASELRQHLQLIVHSPEFASAWRMLETATDPATVFAAIWELAPVPFEVEVEVEFEADHDSAPDLSGIAAKFGEAVKKLKQSAYGYLQLSLQQQDHLPHSTLYLAFLKVFRVAQLDMNQFTERHLEYYYNSILRLAPRAGESDVATVVLTLAETVASLQLPSGTPMTAGSNALGNKILYANTEPVWLNQIGIASLRALYLGSAGTCAATDTSTNSAQPETTVDYIFAAPVADSRNGLGMPLMYPERGWDTFGPNQAQSQAQAQALDANLGLLLTSPVLLVQEGVRKLSVIFNFSEPTLMQKQTSAYVAALNAANSADAAATTIPSDAGELEFGAAFVLYVSSAAGWLPITDFSLSFAADVSNPSLASSSASSWTLKFTLQSDAPALQVNPEPDNTVSSPWPMLKLLINPNAPVYCYSYFQDLTISTVDVQVGVSGLQSLTLDTVAGPVTPGKPFLPFSAVPVPGTSLQVVQQELSAKQVSKATLHIEWLSLPPQGFALYYAGYAPYVFNNEIFTVKLFVYLAGKWQQQFSTSNIADSAQYLMFAQDEDGNLLAQSEFAFTFATPNDAYRQYLQGLANLAAGGTLSAANTMPGTLAVEFAAPVYGFGNAVYPTVFAQAAIENIKLVEATPLPITTVLNSSATVKTTIGKSSDEAGNNTTTETITETIATDSTTNTSTTLATTTVTTGDAVDKIAGASAVVLPNPPYTPSIKSISVDYQAFDCITPVAVHDVARSGVVPQFYQLYPFGFALPQSTPASLYPLAPGRGQLYIGLTNVSAPQSVNLYFEFCEKNATQFVLNANDTHTQHGPTIFWRYLCANQWKDFPANTVVSRTSDFTRSGLVVLQLPEDITGHNTLLPTLAETGTFWLEAYTKQEPSDYNNTVAILPQALEVWRLDPDDLQVLPLPAGSIHALEQSIVEISNVSQPYASRGGRSRESLFQYQARVSERLKHKQRAILPRDYELLVLAAFPAVWQAKCIGPNNSRGYQGYRRYREDNKVPPGNLVLALSPVIEDNPQRSQPLPLATLELVAYHLQALASPFIRQITVRNLSYERLKAFFRVRFKSNQQASVCSAQLNQIIISFLSPWQSEAEPFLPIGTGAVAVLDLARLIRAQAYVEQLGPVWLAHSWHDSSGYQLQWVGEAGTVYCSAPWSVLVSAQQHDIVTLNSSDDELDALPQGIGSLAIGQDFVLGEGVLDAEAEVMTEEMAEAASTSLYVLVIPKSSS